MNIFDLIINDKEQVSLADMVLPSQSREILVQLFKEHRFASELRQYGLQVNNKVLLHGASGCGKTTTAKAIAAALGRPIFVLNLSNVVSARIGETSQNLKMVFERAGKEKAVLFLDEFDQIGKERSTDDKGDVGEMRRLVNTIIQLVDYFPDTAVLVAATNHIEMIDTALARRFQLKIKYELPTDDVLDSYYDTLLSRFPDDMKQISRVYGISFAEAKDYALTLVKAMLIADLESKL